MGIINDTLSSDGGCVPCGGQKTVQEDVLPNPCSPYNEEECSGYTKMSCVYWDGSDFPEYGIENGMRLTEVVLKLLSKLQSIESELP